jgi:hypothetical protein
VNYLVDALGDVMLPQKYTSNAFHACGNRTPMIIVLHTWAYTNTVTYHTHDCPEHDRNKQYNPIADTEQAHYIVRTFVHINHSIQAGL